MQTGHKQAVSGRVHECFSICTQNSQKSQPPNLRGHIKKIAVFSPKRPLSSPRAGPTGGETIRSNLKNVFRQLERLSGEYTPGCTAEDHIFTSNPQDINYGRVEIGQSWGGHISEVRNAKDMKFFQVGLPTDSPTW